MTEQLGFEDFERIEFEDNKAVLSFALEQNDAERWWFDSAYRKIPARPYIETAIQYAYISPQIDGFRIESFANTLIDSVAVRSFHDFRNKYEESNTIVEVQGFRGLTIHRRFGEALLRLAEDHDFSISEVLMTGMKTYFDLKPYRDKGYQVVAMKDNARTLLVATV